MKHYIDIAIFRKVKEKEVVFFLYPAKRGGGRVPQRKTLFLKHWMVFSPHFHEKFGVQKEQEQEVAMQRCAVSETCLAVFSFLVRRRAFEGGVVYTNPTGMRKEGGKARRRAACALHFAAHD